MQVRDLFLSERSLPRVDLIGIISHVLSLSTEGLLASPERTLDESQEVAVRRLIEERRNGKPLAYLRQRREFFSETFYVDERVLIPRPETELLVEEAIKIVGEKERPFVLDMGTGSGIIGILVAKQSKGTVLCVDISSASLAVARKNARAFGLEERIDFVASDLFSGMRPERRFDLICANLPYVGLEEWDDLMSEVREFEPKSALIGGKTGVELYERFMAQVGGCLAPEGVILCEVGGREQAAAVSALSRKAGLDATVLVDLAGKQRVVKAYG